MWLGLISEFFGFLGLETSTTATTTYMNNKNILTKTVTGVKSYMQIQWNLIFSPILKSCVKINMILAKINDLRRDLTGLKCDSGKRIQSISRIFGKLKFSQHCFNSVLNLKKFPDLILKK